MNASDLMSPQVVVAKENTNAEGINARLIAGEFNGVSVASKFIIDSFTSNVWI
jgi:hypothetical protein